MTKEKPRTCKYIHVESLLSVSDVVLPFHTVHRNANRRRMIFFILCCVFLSVHANPFPEGSDAEARWVFHLADHDHNYKLTLVEFQRIFFDFDRNHDKSVTSDEFLVDWRERNLGSSFEAVILFHHLDVDRNGQIEERDIPWILAFFDRNLDGYVGQAEFVITWLKLIHSIQSK